MIRKFFLVLATSVAPLVAGVVPASALGVTPNNCSLAPQPVSVGATVGINGLLNTTSKTVYVVWTFGNGSTVTQAISTVNPDATHKDNLFGLHATTTVLSAGTITATVYRSLATKPMVACTDIAA